MTKKKRCAKTLVVALALTGLGFGGVAETRPGLVASPHRSLKNVWANKQIKGRDYWQVLSREARRTPGVEREPFAQESALDLKYTQIYQNGFVGKNRMSRTLAVREMIASEPDSDRNVLADATLTAETPADVRHFAVEALQDNDFDTAFVVRGDLADPEIRYQGVSALLVARLTSPRSLAQIRFLHGVRGDGHLDRVTMEALQSDGQWLTVPAETRDHDDWLTLIPKTPVSAAAFRFRCHSRPLRVFLSSDWLGDLNALKRAPFEISPPFRPASRNFFGLKPENFDADSFKRVFTDYNESFMGFVLPEWDSNIPVVKNWKDTRSDVDHYLPPYRTRAEALESWKAYFDYQKEQYFGLVNALSGISATSIYAAAWGARTVGLEHTAMSSLCPVRGTLMFLRGGARQFDRYWLHYIAYFALSYSPKPEQPGLGKSPSQSRRELFTSYYMGATFQQFEADCHSLFARPRGAKNYTLSANGEVVRELYQWATSENGRRGASYTPFLFLIDYKTGYNGVKNDRKEWHAWYEIPFNDGDYMIDAFVHSVDKIPLPASQAKTGRGYGDFMTPPYSDNIHNSAIGDLVDVFFANPPQHGGAVKAEQLAKYAVVFLLGDIDVNPLLAERLKAYVEAGGTLVINASPNYGALSDPAFTGALPLDRRERVGIKAPCLAGSGAILEKEFPMPVQTITLRGAEVVEETKTGLPLLTRYRVGAGAVLTCAPVYMLMEDRKQINPLIERLLVRLQKEVLPVGVEGDCQFLVNLVDNKSLRVTLINNEGVIKHPSGSQEIRVPLYAKTVNVVAPNKAIVSEILVNDRLPRSSRDSDSVYTITLPPGEIRIINIENWEKRETSAEL